MHTIWLHEAGARMSALCAILLIGIGGADTHAVTEGFEDWPPAGAIGTYTNSEGWVLGNGQVLTSFRWTSPHSGSYAAWLPDRDTATNAVLRSALLPAGIGAISYWHTVHAYGAPAENVLRIEYSTNGVAWTPVAAVTNATEAWMRAQHTVNAFTPAYIRFVKTADAGPDQYLGLDDITITEPPGLVFQDIDHAPSTPNDQDTIALSASVTGIHPLVSNVAVRAWYRFNGSGPFVSRTMTEISPEAFLTEAPIPAGQTGTVEYYVQATFDGLEETSVVFPAGGAAAPRTFEITGTGETEHDRRQFSPSNRHSPFTITEIMYHPPDRTDGRDTEYVELYNSDPVPHDIGGYRISGDIDFTFPTGTLMQARSYLVVAADPQAIVDLYPVSAVFGPYAHQLPNGGGTVRLRNRTDALLFEAEYDDAWPWPIAADGAGHSLTLAAPDYGEDDRRAWSASSRSGGTPGRPDNPADDALSRVVINEFLAHTDLPQTDFIELYNHGTQPVSIAGCILTDKPETNRFVIPAGPQIPPGGHVVFDQDTLGFSLSMHGDDIYLIDTNGNRVLDAVRFPAQVNGVASGRYPDGGDALRVLAAVTPGSVNASPRSRDVVINEIMYNPISADEVDEYVELYNRAATNVNVGYWRFTDGITCTFPPETVIPAGGYLVIAKDAAHLIAKYPQLDAGNTIGDYTGALSDRGERLVLCRPDDTALPDQDFVVVDTVTYGDGDDWGRWADGDGSSLELVDPRSDNRLAMNWAGSDESAKAPWVEVEFTSSVSNGKAYPTEARAYLLQAGECLLDDIEIVSPEGTVYLNSDFETGQGSWTFWGNHSRSSFEVGTGYGGGHCLHIRASGRGDNGNDQGANQSTWVEAFWNRASAPLTRQPSAGQILTVRARARWLAGWPHGIVGIRAYWLEAPVALKVPGTLGSPGLPNSRHAGNSGPAICDVQHAPALPAAHQDVRVTCRACDPDGVSNVTLAYRVDPSATVVSTNMNDSGLDGDLAAFDGIYSAMIPGRDSGTLVAFAVTASDGVATNRYPEPEPTGAPERECLVRFGHTPPDGAFDSYHLWLTSANVSRWQTIAGGKYSNEPIALTLVYDGCRVEYNGGGRFRGLWRNYGSPETSGAYSISLFGSARVLGGKEIKIDQPGQRGNDGTLQRENYCYWMAKQVDIPACHVHFAHVTFNGGYRGIRHDLQTPALDLCESWYNDPNPTVFKDIGWTDDPFDTYRDAFGRYQQSHYRWNLRKRRPTPPDDDYTPVYALAAAFATQDPAAYTRRVGALLDVRGWLSYFAINAVVTGWDSYGFSWCHNMFAYLPRHRGAALFVYDMDFSLSGNTGDPFFPTAAGKWPVAVRFCEHPAFRRVYWRFLKELAEGPLTAEKTDAHFDNWYQAFLDNGVTPGSPATFKTWIATRRTYLVSQFNSLAAPFEITTNSGDDFDTTASIVTLTGSAPVEIDKLLLNGVEHRVDFPSVKNWTFDTGLVPGPNELTVQGVDASGNVVTSDTITVTFTGTAVSPAGQLVINEIMYNPAKSLAEFVEIHNLSSTETFELGGMRLDGLGYTFPPGSLIGPTGYIVVAENLTAYQMDYGNAEVVAGVYDGALDNGGETLRLLMPVGSNAWTVLDEVRYDDDAPWPATPDGQGPSLQLIDPNRDNNRIGNWAAATMISSPEWQYVAVTGQTAASGVATATLNLYLDAAGELVIDDVRLVQGTDARSGENLLVNGDFESSLSGTWSLSGNHESSGPTNVPVHAGATSLCLRATGPGLSGRFSHSVNQTGLGLSPSTIYTVGVWYYPTTADVKLTVDLTSSDLLGTTSARYVPTALVTSTPGMPNNVRTNLPPFPLLWINEVMPSNATHVADNQGEFEPWIELYNAGASAIDLGAGYYLSDSAASPGRWAFPDAQTVPAGGRILVWADNETGETVPGFLHAGFRLNSVSGCVVLAREQLGALYVLDALTYDHVAEGASYGSYPEGDPGSRMIFHTPTPGTPNRGTSQVTAVMINEWMADNNTAFEDPAGGGYQDWFELYNLGNDSVNLGGYRLTDTTNDTAKYVVPGGIVLNGRDHLLVWADEQTDQTVRGGDLHVNFKLSKNGETIGLYAPDGTLVDAVAFGPQQTDVSEGRWPDGYARVYVMAPSTPGDTNRVLLITALDEISAERMSIVWRSEPGTVYRLERSDNLPGGSWTPVGVVTAEGTFVSLVDTNAPPAPKRFYRLVVQP